MQDDSPLAALLDVERGIARATGGARVVVTDDDLRAMVFERVDRMTPEEKTTLARHLVSVLAPAVIAAITRAEEEDLE